MDDLTILHKTFGSSVQPYIVQMNQMPAQQMLADLSRRFPKLSNSEIAILAIIIILAVIGLIYLTSSIIDLLTEPGPVRSQTKELATQEDQEAVNYEDLVVQESGHPGILDNENFFYPGRRRI